MRRTPHSAVILTVCPNEWRGLPCSIKILIRPRSIETESFPQCSFLSIRVYYQLCKKKIAFSSSFLYHLLVYYLNTIKNSLTSHRFSIICSLSLHSIEIIESRVVSVVAPAFGTSSNTKTTARAIVRMQSFVFYLFCPDRKPHGPQVT